MRSLPKGVHVVRRNGKAYFYWRANKARLPDDFGSLTPDAQSAAIAAVDRAAKDALVVEYQRSPEYRKLKPPTKRSYQRSIDVLLTVCETMRVADVVRSDLLQARDVLAEDAPGVANHFASFCSTFFAFAVDRGKIPFSPAARIKKIKGGHYERWPEDAVIYATTPGNLLEPYRRAVVLALFTGQREGDCCRMTWGQYDGHAIEVRQEKTDATVWIPVHSALKAELDAWKRDTASTSILTNSRGRPWDHQAFRTVFSRLCRSGGHPALTGYQFHGLRKVAAARLAEAGCSTHEIAAITGHRTLAMVELYTREAEQKSRAKAAIIKLERRGNG
jgi:integrase